MKIVVNTRLLIENKLDGIGWFTFETLKRITQNHPEHQFYFLFDRPYSKRFIFSDNVIPIIINPPARHPVLWYLWFEFSVKRVLTKLKADLFLSPDGFLSLSSKQKQISVIHDINFIHRPKDLPFFTRIYYTHFFPLYAKKAHKIVSVSEFSKSDIIGQFAIPENKISVVFNGCNAMYIPVSEDVKAKTKKKYTEGKNYFIFIGTFHPRKNLARLLLAFEQFKIETQSDFKLILVGTKMFLTKDMEQVYNSSRFKKDIIFTGRLNPEELHHVLASAFAMTFVPLFEGFGIPLLEAMNCDVPVICSKTTALPEVAGNAALYVNPFDINEIKNAMVLITKDSEIKNNLIYNGRKRSVLFSWEKTAQKLWEIINETLNFRE